MFEQIKNKNTMSKGSESPSGSINLIGAGTVIVFPADILLPQLLVTLHV